MLNGQGSHDAFQLRQPMRRRSANKGRRYPADPPRIEETIGVMREAGDGPFGCRMRGLIAVLWRAGLRNSEALALAESDLEPGRGSILVRNGKGGKQREVHGRLGLGAPSTVD